MELVWVGIGGGIGAIARYAMGKGITERANSLFPYGTFTVNLLGAFLIGVLFALLVERGVGHPHLRLLLITGFLGGFTTFSAYTIEAITLIEAGSWNTALLYVVASNLLGLLACLAGILAIRTLM
ncbi:fluoride efflux transporter CrcB [soil metagenome]